MIVCSTCSDTHRMQLGDRDVMCTHCPLPCSSRRPAGSHREEPRMILADIMRLVSSYGSASEIEGEIWGNDLSSDRQRTNASNKREDAFQALEVALSMVIQPLTEDERDATSILLDRVGSFALGDATPSHLASIIRKLCEIMIDDGLGEDNL